MACSPVLFCPRDRLKPFKRLPIVNPTVHRSSSSFSSSRKGNSKRMKQAILKFAWTCCSYVEARISPYWKKKVMFFAQVGLHTQLWGTRLITVTQFLGGVYPLASKGGVGSIFTESR